MNQESFVKVFGSHPFWTIAPMRKYFLDRVLVEYDEFISYEVYLIFQGNGPYNGLDLDFSAISFTSIKYYTFKLFY